MIHLTDAKLDDLPLIEAAITPQERALVAETHAYDCLELMRRSLEASELCCVIWNDDKPLMIFGVECSLSTRDGHLWMIGTKHILESKFGFARATKRILKRLTGIYDRLSNVMDCKDVMAVKWARWCGAVVSDGRYARFEVRRG